jgi:3-phenylpropionate/cinnamic acid dioxygenase small subunit
MTDETIRSELDIARLIAQLAIEADCGEIADYLALFTEDAIWEMPANPAAGLAAAHAAGHDEIRAGVEQRRAMGVQGPGVGTMHHITTQRIVVTGDEATGIVYYQFLGTVDGLPTIRTLGEYRDRYRRTSDGWKLAHRTILIH